MKRISIYLIILVLVLSLCACRGPDSKENTTLYELADWQKQTAQLPPAEFQMLLKNQEDLIQQMSEEERFRHIQEALKQHLDPKLEPQDRQVELQLAAVPGLMDTNGQKRSFANLSARLLVRADWGGKDPTQRQQSADSFAQEAAAALDKDLLSLLTIGDLQFEFYDAQGFLIYNRQWNLLKPYPDLTLSEREEKMIDLLREHVSTWDREIHKDARLRDLARSSAEVSLNRAYIRDDRATIRIQHSFPELEDVSQANEHFKKHFDQIVEELSKDGIHAVDVQFDAAWVPGSPLNFSYTGS